EQGEVAEGETQAAHRPDPFAPDPIGEMAERDLSGDAGQTHEAERPGGGGRAESDLDQILRLVRLHRVPGEQAEKIAERDPPEARRAHGAAERPVDGGPGRVDHVRRLATGRAVPR